MLRHTPHTPSSNDRSTPQIAAGVCSLAFSITYLVAYLQYLVCRVHELRLANFVPINPNALPIHKRRRQTQGRRNATITHVLNEWVQQCAATSIRQTLPRSSNQAIKQQPQCALIGESTLPEAAQVRRREQPRAEPSVVAGSRHFRAHRALAIRARHMNHHCCSCCCCCCWRLYVGASSSRLHLCERRCAQAPDAPREDLRVAESLLVHCRVPCAELEQVL